MSVRAKFRKPKSNRKPLGLRTWLIIAGSIVGAFVLAYGITAFSFSQSTGVEVVTVPDVREVTLAAATRAMDRAQLDLVVSDSFPNPSTPAGSVLAQSPLPGQEVSPGSQVEVFLSTGPHRPSVPSVSGMPESLAVRALETAGFEVVVERDTGSVRAGRAIGTEPESGSALSLPATVTLLISTGPGMFEMPAVTGLPEREATTMLEDLGLEVTEVLYDDRLFGEAGAVLQQEPMAGDSVIPGTSVRLLVMPAGDRDRERDQIGALLRESGLVMATLRSPGAGGQ